MKAMRGAIHDRGKLASVEHEAASSALHSFDNANVLTKDRFPKRRILINQSFKLRHL